MRKAKTITMAAAGALMLWGCDVKDPIYETDHPDKGKITLTTTWGATNITAPPAGGYRVVIGDYSDTHTTATHPIDELFTPGAYTVYAYNEPDGIAVGGTTATVSPATRAGNIDNMPGWLYTSATNITVDAGAEHKFTAAMQQQVRQLTLVIEPTGGTADRIESITGTLSGVADSYDMESGAHGTASSVVLSFTEGTDGKWTATVRLLGVTGAEQKLTGTIAFTSGTPGTMPLDSDLSADLAHLNDNTREPKTLGGKLAETPTETGFTATINGWKPISGDSVVAN